MPPRVMLQDIIEAIDLPNRDWKSYLNRETGAIVTVMDDMAMGPDGEVDPADGSRSQILSQVERGQRLLGPPMEGYWRLSRTMLSVFMTNSSSWSTGLPFVMRVLSHSPHTSEFSPSDRGKTGPSSSSPSAS